MGGKVRSAATGGEVVTIWHVRLGESRDRAWCGRYVGFHNPRASIDEGELAARRETGHLASVCGHCLRAIRAAEKRGEAVA